MSAAQALLPRLIASALPPIPPASSVLLGAPSGRALAERLVGAQTVPWEAGVDEPQGDFAAAIIDERLAAMADDLAWLTALGAGMRPGALLFLALPFNPDRFGPGDEAAGWRRRYTRADVRGVLFQAGYQVERAWVAPPYLAGRFPWLDRLGHRLDWGNGIAVRARRRP